MISVEMPITWGTHLDEVFKAIEAQNFKEFEVVAAISTSDSRVLAILEHHGARIVRAGGNILDKRIRAHNAACGSHALMLDETRVPGPGLFAALNRTSTDMVVIPERDIGSTFWIRQANADKQAALSHFRSTDTAILKGFVMPRFFVSELLTKALTSVKRRLTPQVMGSILMEDHQIIVHEAYRLSHSVGLLSDSTLWHYGDETFRSILKKYYRYGRHHAALRGTAYQDLTRTSERVRFTSEVDDLGTLFLQIARGVPFVAGALASRFVGIPGNLNQT